MADVDGAQRTDPTPAAAPGTGRGPAIDRNGLEVLSRAECLQLLASATLGRVAVVEGGVPVVVPVNFALLGEDVVFRTGTGTKLLAAVSRSAVSFEVDSVDETAGSGWSVLVTGGASEISRLDEQASARKLTLHSWVQGRGRYVRIRSEVVSGRRLRWRPPGVDHPHADWNWG